MHLNFGSMSVDLDDEDMAVQDPKAGLISQDSEGLKPSGAALGFVVLSLGMLMSWALVRLNSRIDQRVVLMVLGMVMGCFLNTDTLLERRGSDFMNLLGPALQLAGQLEMNTKMLSDMAGNFMVYSIVGMLLCAGVNAGMMHFILHSAGDMSWRHLIGLGAIIAYPNFSPVKRLLKEFGVSSKVRISITGESMFNGIMFSFLRNLGDSESNQHWLEMISDALKETFGGYAVGVGLGIFSLWGLELASRKHSEVDRSLQVVLTLFCAYGAYHGSQFFLYGKSGDSATLAAAWILSWRMWAVLIAPEDMRSFWGVLDFGSDSFNSFIQGAVLSATFRLSFKFIDGGDMILRIFALWLAVTVGRLAVFLALSPVIDGLGRKMSWRDKALWAWTGTVKGKLSTTIAMYRALGEFNNPDPALKAFNTTLLLYGGGVTFLSLLLNAALTPLVIGLLGLDGRDRPQSQLKTELGKRILRHKVVDELGTETGTTMLERKCPETWAFLQARGNTMELLDKVKPSFYVGMTREVFLKLASRNYHKLSEGKSRRVIRLIASTLLESTIYGRDRCEVGLHDWEFLKECLPELMSEIVFIIHAYVGVQRLTQTQFQDIAIMKQRCQGKEDFFSRGIASAWEVVRKESNRNCRAARKLLSKLDAHEVRLSAERQAAWDVCDVLEDQGGFLETIGLFEDSETLFGCILADVKRLDRVRTGESKNIDIMEKVNESEAEEEFDDLDWDNRSVQTLEELRTFALRSYMSKRSD